MFLFAFSISVLLMLVAIGLVMLFYPSKGGPAGEKESCFAFGLGFIFGGLILLIYLTRWEWPELVSVTRQGDLEGYVMKANGPAKMFMKPVTVFLYDYEEVRDLKGELLPESSQNDFRRVIEEYRSRTDFMRRIAPAPPTKLEN